MKISSQQYFSRRASEEAARAARELEEEGKRWHQELAEKFSKLAKEQ